MAIVTGRNDQRQVLIWQRRGGRGGETEWGSSLQMGDMLEPDTDMLGEVAGELLTNWNENIEITEIIEMLQILFFYDILFDFDKLTDFESVDNERLRTANNRDEVDQI